MDVFLRDLALGVGRGVEEDAGFVRGGGVADPLREAKLDVGFDLAGLGVGEISSALATRRSIRMMFVPLKPRRVPI